MTTNLPEMKLTGVTDFYGREHPIYTLLNTQYISMRPVVTQLGLDWQSQKKSLIDNEDAVRLFGALLIENRKVLQPPSTYQLKSDILPNLSSANPVEVARFGGDDAPEDTVFIKAKSVYMYIFRIDLDEANRNSEPEAIVNLFMLQEEMADFLHNYETHGIAAKNPGEQS